MANKPEKTGLLDPRQILFWNNYVDPESPTFNQIVPSGIAAGYSESSGKKIQETEWFKGKMRRLQARILSEEVILDMLKMPVERQRMVGQDLVTDVDPALLKIKQDTAKFAASTLGKEEWSTRTELTGVDGGPIVTTSEKKKADEAINEFISETYTR